MSYRWFKRKKKRPRSVSRGTKHYLEHKEAARALIHERLLHYNKHYGLTYKRVAIRNPKRNWGSCSSLKNLNFSYKILFLPSHLQDYIIVHELCHLAELNHSANFWQLVADCAPAYQEHVKELRAIDAKSGGKVAVLTVIQSQYPVPATVPRRPSYDRETNFQLLN